MKDKEVVPYGAKVRNLVKKFGGVTIKIFRRKEW